MFDFSLLICLSLMSELVGNLRAVVFDERSSLVLFWFPLGDIDSTPFDWRLLKLLFLTSIVFESLSEK
jgi:hypothetical protein